MINQYNDIVTEQEESYGSSEVYMIGYIKGTIENIAQDYVVIDNQGIGYRIFTSNRAIDSLMGSHNSVKLYTYMHVKEDGISLYGFPTEEELNTFKLLITVNGVGPKAALAILSVLSVQDLALAIIAGDTKAITKANGVGAKGANRIIMELKDKLQVEDAFGGEEEIGSSGTGTVSIANGMEDTVLALVSLGYSEFEAIKAIKQIPGADSRDFIVS